MNELLMEQIEEFDPEVLLIDDCNEAIIGYVDFFGAHHVAYSYKKLVECFVNSGMTTEDALDWIDYNVIGAYMGEKTPIIVMDDLLGE